MKSSTIRRSTLSRESMEVIENLAKEQEEGGLGEYVRPDEIMHMQDDEPCSKAQEIDLLWQNFKSTQFNTNSPTAYILLGFLIGVVTTVIAFAGLRYMSKSHFSLAGVHKPQEQQTLEQQTALPQDETENKVLVPTDAEVAQLNTPSEAAVQNSENVNAVASETKMEKYIVKDGDTVENIIKHYYGSYSPEKAELIMKVNNLKTLDRINIDQEILIPINQ